MALIAVILITSISILCLFSKSFSSPNTTFFASGGDGIKCYYGIGYHVRYDTTFTHLQGMNYPYGEHLYFTDGMAPVSNSVKLIKPFVDLSEYTVGIINLLMLIAPIIAAGLYLLIFKSLKVPVLVSILGAVGIVLLSPQWARIEGHFSLSLQFFIPFLIFQLIRFHQKRSWWPILWMSIGTFLMMLLHPYYFPMSALLIVSYFAYFGLIHAYSLKLLKKYALPFLVALIGPFLLFNLSLKLTGDFNDRTALPWGFWEYKSNLSGVFFPFGKPYEDWARMIATPVDVSWEGVAFVGLFSIIMIIAACVFVLIKMVKTKSYFSLLNPARRTAEQNLVFFILIAGVAGMLVSFAFPFNLGLESWVDHLGVIKQLRGIGRMNWLFYCAVNIFGVFFLCQILKKKNDFLKFGIITPLIFLLFLDGYYNVKNLPDKIVNEKPEFIDFEHNLPENQWLKTIDAENYQAIIPLPYFLIGSENLSSDAPEELIQYVLSVSYTTGIPTTGVVLSRTSLSQTKKHIQMHQEPYRKLEILEDFPNRKPFLIIVAKGLKDKYINGLLHDANLIAENENYLIYELSFDKLETTYTKYGLRIYNEYSLVSNEKLSSSDSSYFYCDTSSHAFEINQPYCILDNFVYPSEEEVTVRLSFWMDGFYKDLYTRSALEVAHVNKEVVSADYFGLTGKCIAIDENKGLFEVEFNTRPSDTLRVTLMNSEILDNLPVEISSVLVYKLDSKILQKRKNVLFINNRTYSYVP